MITLTRDNWYQKWDWIDQIGDCSRKLYHHITKMGQILEHLLAEIRTIQEKMETNQEWQQT
jgi:hypothetical protein